MERLVLFTKQRANLPLTYVHDDGKEYQPGCGVAAQTAVDVRRACRCDEIDIILDGEWIRADIVAVLANRRTGVDVFYNNAREMTGDRPRRTRGPGYVRYVNDTSTSTCPTGLSR